jgi:hypothetical protein
MLSGKPEREARMVDLENEIRAVMCQNVNALTVDQVTQKVAERIKEEVRIILNGLVAKQELESVHGGGGYQTHYKAPPIKLRV